MGYAHKVEGTGQIELKNFDTASNSGLKREEGEERTAQIIEELIELQ